MIFLKFQIEETHYTSRLMDKVLKRLRRLEREQVTKEHPVGLGTVLVSQDWHNKAWIVRWLKITEMLLFHRSGGYKSKIKVSGGPCAL